MKAVHAHLPKPHDPFVDLVPPQGIKLTPQHYAYLKISEGCNHRCTFCIIPSMRGDLVSRPIGEVMQEAENLVKAGVKELLVISQDTSAYGVDVKYRTGFHGGKPVKTNFLQLCRSLGELGVWVRLHYVYPYPERRRRHSADGRREDPSLPRHPVPAREPAHPQAHEAPGGGREGARAHPRLARGLPGPDDPQHLHRRLSGRDRGGIRGAFDLPQGGAAGPRGMLRLFAGGRGEGERVAGSRCRKRSGKSGSKRFMEVQATHQRGKTEGEGRPDAQGPGRCAGHRALDRGRAGDRWLGLLRKDARSEDRAIRRRPHRARRTSTIYTGDWHEHT